jgi:dihydrofolate reductase
VAKVVAGMTVSLDGYAADENGSVSRLYTDFAALRESEYLTASIAETGAVLMGKRAFEMGDPDSWGDYEYQVPIFVLTHSPPEVAPKHLTFTFVTDGVESAVAQATEAAGDKVVTVVGGVSTVNQLLRAGLADELHLDVMPVLLAGGLRFFEEGLEHVRLAKLEVQEVGKRTGLRFRVGRA